MLKVLKMMEMIKSENKPITAFKDKQRNKQKNLLVCYLTIKTQLQHSKTSSHTSSSCLVPHTTSRSHPNIVTTSRFVQKSQNRYLPNLFNPNISTKYFLPNLFLTNICSTHKTGSISHPGPVNSQYKVNSQFTVNRKINMMSTAKSQMYIYNSQYLY